VFYWAITPFITPPVALRAYVAAGIANASPMKTGFLAMRLGIITYVVPFLFVYNPELLLLGNPVDITISVISSLAGVVFLSLGLSNFDFSKRIFKASWIAETVPLIFGGLLMMKPGLYTDLAGAAIACTALMYKFMADQRKKTLIQSNPVVK